ncbi:MAG: hypothetical protein COW85_05200 [Ignavibacteria bacterium CG22_combo_CG10-13_8_21_14_all_37_15]|nr:MAG: hypothetical protein COW85_05200 [Ignavibacteria bacterium CG22_combo_CG10-13_8_21_14_all_37_15]
MKKLLVLTLLFLPFFIGCNKNEAPKKVEKTFSTTFDSSDIKTVPLSDATFSSVDLSYGLKKGSVYDYRLTSITNDDQSIVADTSVSQKIKQALTYLLKLSVKDVDKDGVMEIEFIFSSVKLDASGNGQSFSYQSGRKLSNDEKSRYADYEAIINNPFTARVAPKGEILEFFRTDRIANKLLELKGLKDSVSMEEKKMLQQQISEGALRPLLTQVFRKLPDQQVKKDSSWTLTNPPVQLPFFEMTNTLQFRITGFEKYHDDNLAVLDAGLTSKYKISERAKQAKVTVKSPSYSGEGKIYFNLSKGLVERSKTNLYLTIEMSMNTPSRTGGMQKVTQKQITKTTNILELL